MICTLNIYYKGNLIDSQVYPDYPQANSAFTTWYQAIMEFPSYMTDFYTPIPEPEDIEAGNYLNHGDWQVILDEDRPEFPTQEISYKEAFNNMRQVILGRLDAHPEKRDNPYLEGRRQAFSTLLKELNKLDPDIPPG